MFVIYEYMYIARQSVFLMVETKIFINLGNDIHVLSFKKNLKTYLFSL